MLQWAGLCQCAQRDRMVRCFLHAAGGRACAAAPNEIAWYVALLHAPLCGARRVVPCWPAESLALLYIADALADIVSCCNCCCTAAALNLHHCPLRGVVPVLCTTRQVTGSRRKRTTCALWRSGTRIKSLPCE